MTITATGLVTKRFPEILQELRTRLIEVSGNPNLDLSDNSILGILNSVYGSSSADQQELIQAVFSAGDIDTAEGVLLDRLVAYIGLTRLAGRPSNGFFYFTSTNIPTTVPVGTRVISVNRDVALTSSLLRINPDLCYQMRLDFVVQDSTAYTVRINSVDYTYTSGVSATKNEIATGLSAAITNALLDKTVNADDTLSVSNSSGSNGINFSLQTGNISIVSITSRVAGSTPTNGAFEFPVGSLNRLESPIGGLSVTNLTEWSIGAARESDEDLRLRHSQSTQLVGLRTEAAIIARVLAIQGVQKALLRDNVLDVTDPVTGLPPHSFEVVVKGGDDTEIATAILNTKSAGIQTFGTEEVRVADDSGIVRQIFFSRPADIILWVRVEYELYDEESAPSDLEDLIKEQVLDYGQSLDIGEDVIPTRFLPNIYRNIDGLGAVTVLLGTSVDTITPPASYSAVTIPIGEFEESSFALNRITTVDVTP